VCGPQPDPASSFPSKTSVLSPRTVSSRTDHRQIDLPSRSGSLGCRSVVVRKYYVNMLIDARNHFTRIARLTNLQGRDSVQFAVRNPYVIAYVTRT